MSDVSYWMREHVWSAINSVSPRFGGESSLLKNRLSFFSRKRSGFKNEVRKKREKKTSNGSSSKRSTLLRTMKVYYQRGQLVLSLLLRGVPKALYYFLKPNSLFCLKSFNIIFFFMSTFSYDCLHSHIFFPPSTIFFFTSPHIM